MPMMEISATKLIADLNSGDYKQYESELQELEITAMNDAQFESILSLFFEKKLSLKIKNINASFSNLKKVPEGIENLTELQELSVRHTALETLPETLWNCRKLTCLNFEHNFLKSLGEGIGQCLHLKEIYVMDNKLEDFPYTLGACDALEKLFFEKNPLLPTAPKSIDGLKARWQGLQSAYLIRAKAIVEFFRDSHQIPDDLLKIIINYAGCDVAFTPIPELLEKNLQKPLQALFEVHKRTPEFSKTTTNHSFKAAI
ncbi:MAG TPA: hypothetical protein VNK03_04380 [Gammaproteobacteria bacterium]|nr:hypothetical protein [Gammaproteobacteria bacterium]